MRNVELATRIINRLGHLRRDALPQVGCSSSHLLWLAAEQASQRACVEVPVRVPKLAHRLQPRRLLGASRSGHPQYEVRYLLGVLDGIVDCHRSVPEEPDQCEPVKAHPLYHCLEIQHFGLKRIVGRVAVRQTSPSAVVVNEHSPFRQPLVPASHVRSLPLQLDMTEFSCRHLHYGHSLSQGPECNVHTVARLRVLDARLHQASSRQRTSNRRTGSSKPRRATSPRSPNMKPLPSASSRTTFATMISPPWASAAIRAARMTAVPNRSPRPSGSSSAMGSPAFSPMRTRRGEACLAPTPVFHSAIASCMAMAHSSAFTAEPKEAMKPSPIVFTSLPPWAFSASRVMRSCSRSTSPAFASPRRWVIAVDPSMSVKRIVWRPAGIGAAAVRAVSSPSPRNSSMKAGSCAKVRSSTTRKRELVIRAASLCPA